MTETQLQLQFFEDLPLGGEWSTRRRTISEADLALFSGLVGDFSPLTVDAEHAATTHFGSRVASASFLVAAALGLGSMDAPLPHSAGLVGMTWKFMRPVRAGDTIFTVWRLARKRPVENLRWGLAVWQVAIRNQKGDTCAEGELARLVARREQPVSAAAPSGRRRRRRRAGAGAGAGAVQALVDAPAPEPAPADVPPPSRRRRGRGGSEPKPPEVQAAPALTEPGAEPAPQPGPSRRRRRRRGNGSRATNGADPNGQATTEPPPSPPAPPPEPPGGISNVLRRIRRRR